jgi:hypothetical protein
MVGMPTHIINAVSNLVTACRGCNMDVAKVKFEEKIFRFGRFAQPA